jgi:hypothetical protein
VRLEYASGVGRRDPIPDQQVAFVSGGRVVAVITTSRGEGELPAGLDTNELGIGRVGENTASDPLAVVDERIAVIRPGTLPLLLFDAGLADADLALLSFFGSTAVQIQRLKRWLGINDSLGSRRSAHELIASWPETASSRVVGW